MHLQLSWKQVVRAVQARAISCDPVGRGRIPIDGREDMLGVGACGEQRPLPFRELAKPWRTARALRSEADLTSEGLVILTLLLCVSEAKCLREDL